MKNWLHSKSIRKLTNSYIFFLTENKIYSALEKSGLLRCHLSTKYEKKAVVKVVVYHELQHYWDMDKI